jgi:predicted RNA methylase
MGKTQNQGIEALIKSDYYRRGLFTSSEQISRDAPLLPHSHTVRRAFDRLDLDAVLYVDRAPTAYFKRVKDLIAKDIRNWQTYLWNQHIVPLLVVISDTQIKVYSGQALPTDNDNDIDSNGRLVKVFKNVADVLELEVLASIETGEIFRNSASFNRKHAVDRCLLENLTAAAKKLVHCPDKPFTAEFAHLFLIRLLFACYLIERKMIKGKHFADDSDLCNIGGKYERLKDMLNDLPPVQARNALFRLFGYLKERFNGSLLDSDLEEEENNITDKHIEIIKSFLKGDDLKSGQYALKFWAYDFSIIPIETISSIYQGFISEQGKLQETSGAYYTPPHLAELTVDILLEGHKEPLYESKVLDPACGSGVFLVSMFNRMANQWMSNNGNRHLKTRAKELLNILENRLFGVDVNETACHITCFSLYLAVLEQLEPCDVEELIKRGLKFPALLSTQNETKPIVHDNFFNPNLKLTSKEFDFVIGNPPWVSRGKCEDQFFLDWRKDDKEVRGPQKQIAHGFMWKVPERLNGSGKACLLLPTAVLLNKTDKFQAAWFSQVTVEKVVNFSDLRFVLFADAIHPCIAVRFNKIKPDITKNKIRYDSPKADIHSQLGGAVYIYDEDIKTIRLSELLSKAQDDETSRIWKAQFWGTWRDLKFLQRLSDMPRLRDVLKGTHTGVGIQPVGGDPNPIWWEKDRLFLDANNKLIQLVVTQDDCRPVGNMFPDKIHRPRTQEIFSPPLLVFNKGFSKISFVGFPVLFTDSLFSISSPGGNDSVLRFLVAVLRSRLAKYYYFHTVSNYGIERTQLFTEQITDCPFLMPKDTHDPKKGEDILCEVSNKLRNFETNLRNHNYTIGRLEKVRQIQDECELLIRKYYDIDDYEQVLIEDTVNYIIPSITPSEKKEIKTLRPANNIQRQQYTETLCGMLNIHAKEGKKVEARVIKSDSQAVVVISRANGKQKSYQEISTSQEMGQVLDRIAKLLPAKRGGFVYCRNLKLFDRDHIYIVKPMTLRSWMRSTALNDADEIAAAVLRVGEVH